MSLHGFLTGTAARANPEDPDDPLTPWRLFVADAKGFAAPHEAAVQALLAPWLTHRRPVRAPEVERLWNHCLAAGYLPDAWHDADPTRRMAGRTRVRGRGRSAYVDYAMHDRARDPWLLAALAARGAAQLATAEALARVLLQRLATFSWPWGGDYQEPVPFIRWAPVGILRVALRAGVSDRSIEPTAEQLFGRMARVQQDETSVDAFWAGRTPWTRRQEAIRAYLIGPTGFDLLDPGEDAASPFLLTRRVAVATLLAAFRAGAFGPRTLAATCGLRNDTPLRNLPDVWTPLFDLYRMGFVVGSLRSRWFELQVPVRTPPVEGP